MASTTVQRPRDNQAGIVPQARRTEPCTTTAAVSRPAPPPQARVVSSRNGEEAVAQAQARPTPEQRNRMHR